MDVLCLNYEYPPIGGGGGAACKDLAESVARLGVRVDLVTSSMNGLAREEQVGGVRIHRVTCLRRHRHYVGLPGMLTQVFPLYRRARQLTRKHDYLLNHTHFIVPTALSSWLLWRKTGLPYVITTHGSDVPGYNPDRFGLAHRLIRPIWNEILNHAAGVITPSLFIRDLLWKSARVPTEVIPYGLDFPGPGTVTKKDRILLVTRMFERKGVQYFLEAIRELNTDWEIVIAGDGPYLPTLREMAKGIVPAVRFTGFVQGQTLTDLYHSARVFVFPSIQENFPVVLMEAMSAGCAVITTTASGCAEVVGGAAIKVEPKDVAGLNEAVGRLIADRGEVERLAGLSRERASRLSSESVAKRHVRLYRRFGDEPSQRLPTTAA